MIFTEEELNTLKVNQSNRLQSLNNRYSSNQAVIANAQAENIELVTEINKVTSLLEKIDQQLLQQQGV